MFFKYFGPSFNKAAIYIAFNNTKYNRRHYFNTQRFSSLVQLSVYSNKLVQLLFLHGCRKAAVHSLADFQRHGKVIVFVKLLSFSFEAHKKIESSSDAGAKLKDWQRPPEKEGNRAAFIIFSTFNHSVNANLIPILGFQQSHSFYQGRSC